MHQKRILSNAAYSVIQAIVSGIVLFFMYRHILAELGAVQLGLWTTIIAGASIARLSDLGLTGSVVKFVAKYLAQGDAASASRVLQTAAICIGAFMGVLVVAIYPAVEFILPFFLPDDSIKLANALVPWALASLLLGGISGVFQSGLDGCHRMDLRNMVLIVGNLFMLLVTYYAITPHGIVGLAIGQMTQSIIILILYIYFLRRQLTTFPWIPIYFSKEKFREMFAYSVNFQINSVAVLAFEPITKLLMSRYGGLEASAYFEMANQMVVKLRALLVSASQAIVPAVAELQERSPVAIRPLYERSYELVYFFSIILYSTIFVALPVISHLWIGHIEPQFLFFGAAVSVGWGLNNLIAPAYFTNLGTGQLFWNSVSHVCMALMNLTISTLIGMNFGATGVVIGAMISLVVASSMVLISTTQRLQIRSNALMPKVHRELTVFVALCILILIVVPKFFPSMQWRTEYLYVAPTLYLLLFVPMLWCHPYKNSLAKIVFKSKN